MEKIKCARCGGENDVEQSVTFKNYHGTEYEHKVCKDCWHELLKLYHKKDKEVR